MYDIKHIELENYQSRNGLFPAAINSKNELMNERFWIRDNYYIYLAVDLEIKKRMFHAFEDLVDYLDHLGKFNHRPTEEWMYIHPLYDKDLKEIDSGWSWVQNDCAGNLLEILSEGADKRRSTFILNYLDNIEYWKCPDYGFWEEGPREIRSSSLAACIRGIESFEKNINVTEQTIYLKNKGDEALRSLLPDETPTRNYDLALLSVIYPKQLVDDDMKQRILNNTRLHLEKTWGIIRYPGDKWDGQKWDLGKGKEMPWPIGLAWKSLAGKEASSLLRLIEIKKRSGKIPGGIIEGMPNCTPLSLWAEAMYKLAIEDFITKAKSGINA